MAISMKSDRKDFHIRKNLGNCGRGDSPMPGDTGGLPMLQGSSSVITHREPRKAGSKRKPTSTQIVEEIDECEVLEELSRRQNAVCPKRPPPSRQGYHHEEMGLHIRSKQGPFSLASRRSVQTCSDYSRNKTKSSEADDPEDLFVEHNSDLEHSIEDLRHEAPARRLCQTYGKTAQDSKLGIGEALWAVPLHSTAVPTGGRSPDFDISSISQSPISGPFKENVERDELRTLKTSARSTRKRGKSAEVRREGLVCKKYTFQPPDVGTSDKPGLTSQKTFTGSTVELSIEHNKKQSEKSAVYLPTNKEKGNEIESESDSCAKLGENELNCRDVLEISPRLMVLRKGSRPGTIQNEPRTPESRLLNHSADLSTVRSKTEYSLKLPRDVGSPHSRSLTLNKSSQLVVKGTTAGQHGRPGSSGETLQRRKSRNSFGRRSLEIPESLRREALRRKTRSNSSQVSPAHHYISPEHMPIPSTPPRYNPAAPLTSSAIEDNNAKLVIDLSAVPSFADIDDDVELRPRSLSRFINSDEIVPHMEEFSQSPMEVQLLQPALEKKHLKPIATDGKKNFYHSSPIPGHSNFGNPSPNESVIRHYSNAKHGFGSNARQLRFAVARPSRNSPRLLLSHINKSVLGKASKDPNLSVRFSTGAVRMPPLTSTTVLLPSTRVD